MYDIDAEGYTRSCQSKIEGICEAQEFNRSRASGQKFVIIAERAKSIREKDGQTGRK